MLVRLFSSLVVIFSLAACSSMDGFLQFAGEKVNYNPSMEELIESHSADYQWPIENADLYLQVAEPGEIIPTTTYENEPAVFMVAYEYRSAGKQFCKNYYVNDQEHLACFNPHWKPMRLFK